MLLTHYWFQQVWKYIEKNGLLLNIKLLRKWLLNLWNDSNPGWIMPEGMSCDMGMKSQAHESIFNIRRFKFVVLKKCVCSSWNLKLNDLILYLCKVWMVDEKFALWPWLVHISVYEQVLAELFKMLLMENSLYFPCGENVVNSLV